MSLYGMDLTWMDHYWSKEILYLTSGQDINIICGFDIYILQQKSDLISNTWSSIFDHWQHMQFHQAIATKIKVWINSYHVSKIIIMIHQYV